MGNVKETVIQFGEGGFLRGFVDYFLQKMKDQGLFDGSVVVVQPIEKGMCEMLEKQNCQYNLFLRGIDNGQVVDEHTHIDIINRCINPYADPEGYMALAENRDLRFIVSNTTEAGIEFVPENRFEDKPAKSFPGKLTQLLYKRFQLGLPGFIVLSCELIDHNGEELEKCCLQYADLWNLGDEFKNWMKNENDFCSTLVDRIVTGFPRDEPASLCQRIGEQDNMMDTAEIFHLWVIQGNHEDELPLQKAGFNVVWTDNVDPYKKRKVRILNGAHTSMVLAAHLAGFKIVRDCMEDETVQGFMNRTISEEIIPTLDLPRADLEDFASAVADRFNNPYIDHALLSIALNSTAKWKARVMPSLLEYAARKGTLPPCITFSFAAYIAFYRDCPAQDDPWVLEFYQAHRGDSPAQLVHAAIHNERMWGGGLAALEGFEEAVTAALERIDRLGAYEAMKECLA